MPDYNKRIESLDGLRGIAALTVIGSHINLDYFAYIQPMPLRNTPLHVFYDGEAAVVFFFVLSGFVLSHKYVSRGKEGLDKFSFRGFIVSRLFRIYPMFWAALALTAFCATHFSHSYQNIPFRNWTIGWYNYNFNAVNFFKQATLIYVDPILGPWIGPVINHQSYIPQYWTLNVELILSILVPLLILIAVNRPRWLIFLTVILVGMFNVYTYLMHFVLGVLLAIYLPRITRYFGQKNTGFKTLLLTIGIFLYSWRYSVAAHFGRVSVLQKLLFSEISILLIVGLGVYLIIAVVLNSNRLKLVLCHPAVNLIGRVSYGIYLCHTIMLAIFTPMLIYWFNQHDVTNTIIVIGISFVCTVCGSIIIAYILHRVVELNFITIGKKVNTYLGFGS
jgi:peptidoglycan/LPS O-acetylase OafA/YrhL